MRVELSTLHAQLGATMIYVTHDQVEAMTMASRIVVLNHGQVEQVGSPLDLYRNPDNYFVHIEQSAFNPSNVVPGVGFSPDKMLQGRLFSYPDAHRYRIVLGLRPSAPLSHRIIGASVA